MNKGLFSRRIPTILGILILLGGLITGVILVGQRQGFGIRAGPTAVPKNVKIVNRGSNTFTVTWISDVPVTGFLKYSDNPARLTLPAGDTRDQVAGSTSQYTTHFVEVTGLTADKTYYFEIGSGSQTYNDGGRPYQVRTAVAAAAPAEDVTSGKVLTAAAAGAGGVLVYVDLTGAETLGALTRNDGSYRLALSNARDRTGKYLTYDKAKENLTLFAQGGTAGTATALTNTANDNPVPDITLGKTHNFVGGEFVPEVVSGLQTGGTATAAGFASLGETVTPPEATYSVKLSYPATEGEKIATTSPEFRGVGTAGTILNLSVTSLTVASQSGMATISAATAWQWPIPKALALGRYTISLSWKEGAVTNRFSRGFEIVTAAVGGLPAFSATPSATPTATPSGRTVMPSTEAGVPQAGVLTPTLVLLIVGIGLFGGGLIWHKKLLAEI